MSVEDKLQRKKLFARMMQATGFSATEAAERLKSFGKISEGSVKSFLKKDPLASNAPKVEKLNDMAEIVVEVAREIIAHAALQEAMTPLTRQEFERGIELTHGRVSGVADFLDMTMSISADGGDFYRASIVGSTGCLGHVSIPLDGWTLAEARQHILDGAWSAYERMTAPKTLSEIRELVESTIKLVSDENGNGDGYVWVAQVFGRNGKLTVTLPRSEFGDRSVALDRIIDTAYVNYQAALEGIASRVMYREERAARKASFRELRRLFGLDFATIAEITGKEVKSVEQWTDDSKEISPNAAVYDVLQSYRQSWASKQLLAADVDMSSGRSPYLSFIAPTLPKDFRDVVARALAIHAKELSDIPHWKTSEKLAREAGFAPKALRARK